MGLRNNNILSLLEVKTEDYGERVALGMKNSFGWKEFTYKGIGLLSRKLAHYFINELGTFGNPFRVQTRIRRLRFCINNFRVSYGAFGCQTYKIRVEIHIIRLPAFNNSCFAILFGYGVILTTRIAFIKTYFGY